MLRSDLVAAASKADTVARARLNASRRIHQGLECESSFCLVALLGGVLGTRGSELRAMLLYCLRFWAVWLRLSG